MSVKITFYGHSTFMVESDGVKILIDPFFDENPMCNVKAEEVDADFILVSHGHFDHIADAAPIAKRTGAQVISNFEIVSWLGNQGVENGHPLHIGGGNQFKFGRCKMTIAHHGSMLPDGSYGGNPGGFLLKLNNGKTIYYSGDTALTYDMKWLADEDVDVALLCVGDNFTMGPDDAIKAIELIQPKVVVPDHYNTWPYIEIDVDAFAQRVVSETEAKCKVMQSGETFELE